jgi:hypothetical protein
MHVVHCRIVSSRHDSIRLGKQNGNRVANTGPALFPGTTTYPGTGVYPGQGTAPIVRCYLSTDDVSVSTPTWTDVTSKLRSVSISRGRQDELGEVDAGTATIVLDNRDRSFDPTINAQVKPLNRIWLSAEFSGERQDLFRGYAEMYQQQWPGGGSADAICVGSFADELKILNLAGMPLTSPPRDSYANVVLFDAPTGYWGLGDNSYEYAQVEVQDKPPAVIAPPAAADAGSSSSGSSDSSGAGSSGSTVPLTAYQVWRLG